MAFSVLDFDRNPALSDVERLQSFLESVQRAFNEFELTYDDLELEKHPLMLTVTKDNKDFRVMFKDYGEFKVITTKAIEAVKGDFKNLSTKYANIDFSNIGKAAMEYFYSTSGLIKDVTVGDQTITGHLVGVTISGDLIEGNTVKAEKLVIKGEDGLYYKLNIEGGSTTTEEITEEDLQNGLDGRNIIAKTITATQISVSDLVAFDATIGGFEISDTGIHSIVKTSVDNTTRGAYLDSDGQFNFGDANSYLMGYIDEESGEYRIVLKAHDIILKGVNVSIETAIEDSVQDALTQAKESGEFKGDKGDTGETGPQGPQGPTGPGGADGQMLYATSSTAAGTAAKVATLSAGSLTLKAGVSVSVKFTNANTAINPTLNVNGTGAKVVYTNGVRYAFWSAGQTVVFTYDGTNWQVASTPVYANIATVGNSAGRNVYIDDEAAYIRNGTTVLASFDEDEIYLGKNTPSAAIHLCGNIATLSGYSVDNGAYEALAITSNYIRLSAIAPSQAGAGAAPSIEVSLDKVYVSGPLDVTGTLNATGAVTFGGTLKVSGVSTLGRINASNEYLTGSLYVGGKTSTSDGKPGVAFGASGNITMQSTSTAKINFINGTNKSAKAYIASGSSNDISLVAPGYIAFVLNDADQIWYKPSATDASITYFYPFNDTACRLGSTSNRWYRLYQSYSSVSTSDKRQKENIKALKNVKKNRKKADGTKEEFDVYAELFDRLEPVEYNFIEGEKRKDFGLIAQDVLKVMAELGLEEDELDLVHHDTWIDEETGEERDGYGIAYENLIAVLIHEVQKLKATVKHK